MRRTSPSGCSPCRGKLGGDQQCSREEQLCDSCRIERIFGIDDGVCCRGEGRHRREAPDEQQQVVESRADDALAAALPYREEVAGSEGNEGAPEHLRAAGPAEQCVFGQGGQCRECSPDDEELAADEVHAAHVAVEDAGDEFERLLFGKSIGLRFFGFHGAFRFCKGTK